MFYPFNKVEKQELKKRHPCFFKYLMTEFNINPKTNIPIPVSVSLFYVCSLY